VGVTLAELADGLGLPVPAGRVRTKGWSGQIIERELGAGDGSGRGQDFAALGIELKTVPASSYFDSVRAGAAASGWTIASTSWIGDFADPLAFLQMWAQDSNLNDASLADPEYDRLLGAAALKSGDERFDALGLAETRLLSGAAVLPIYHSLAANVIDTDFVNGWYPNALDIHPFKYLAFGERRIRANVAVAR